MRRIAYVRHDPFGLADLAPLFVGEPKVHRFSAYLDHANDAWTAPLVGGARATGTLAGRSLLVTYEVLGPATRATQAFVERWLAENFGPIVVVGSLLEADRWFREHVPLLH